MRSRIRYRSFQGKKITVSDEWDQFDLLRRNKEILKQIHIH